MFANHTANQIFETVESFREEFDLIFHEGYPGILQVAIRGLEADPSIKSLLSASAVIRAFAGTRTQESQRDVLEDFSNALDKIVD